MRCNVGADERHPISPGKIAVVRQRDQAAKGLVRQHDPSVGIEQKQGFVRAVKDGLRDGQHRRCRCVHGAIGLPRLCYGKERYVWCERR